jgi:pseudo-rSAM protein
LCVEEIENIFRQILYSSVGKINISGGNIFQYQDLERLKKLFDSFSETIHCYFHYENFKVNILPDSLKLELIVNFPLDEVAFKNAWYSINKKNTTVHFIIEDEEQYAKVDYLADKFFIEKYNVQSFFTGENMDFFSGNIFLDKEDIFTKTLSIREIFRSQKLNSNFFGSLFVLPDGSVKANMNCQSIGNIKTDNLLNLIYKEMLENTAWRKIRDEKPCADCLYQYLCPSPSNYGTAIGKPDLCHIKE